MSSAKKWSWPVFLIAPSVLVVLGLLIVPITQMLRYSFYRHAPPVRFVPAFTFENYLRFFSDSFYLQVAAQTFGLALGATIMALIFGYPMAYYLARTRTRVRGLLLAIVITPLTLSIIVMAFGWLILMLPSGTINWVWMKLPWVDTPIKLAFTKQAALIALTQVNAPYMILPLIGCINNIDPALEEAASNLGANKIQVFFRVLLPLSVPGILAGSTFVFLLSLVAFVVPRLIGGPSMEVVGNLIYDHMMLLLNWPFAAAMGIMLLVASLLIYGVFVRLLQSEYIERERKSR